jgi:hypothetical protein
MSEQQIPPLRCGMTNKRRVGQSGMTNKKTGAKANKRQLLEREGEDAGERDADP